LGSIKSTSGRDINGNLNGTLSYSDMRTIATGFGNDFTFEYTNIKYIVGKHITLPIRNQ
jgi:hypothetical protein